MFAIKKIFRIIKTKEIKSMLKIKKLLFPTDFSKCADQALNHAVFYAEKYGAELHILHAITLFADQPDVLHKEFLETDDMIKNIERNFEEQMIKVARKHENKEIKIFKSCKRGISAAPTILEYASEKDVDLIIMGTQGRRGLAHIMLGSTAEEVVRMADCPVFTIREKETAKPIKAFQQILVPVDFSEHSATAIAYAKRIAQDYDAQLQLLHIIENTTHPAFSLSGKSSIYDFFPNIKEDSINKVKKMFDEANGPEVKSEIFIKDGHPAHETIEFSKEKGSDLIVISTHGLTGVDHFLLGSVSEKVVRRAFCPVFTVRTFGKSLI